MWNKVFRRSVIEPNLMAVDPKIKNHEDGLATFASFLDAKSVVISGQKLYHYRRDNISVTRSYCTGQFQGMLVLADSLEKINRQKQTYDLSEQIDFYLLYNVYSVIFEEFYFRHRKPFVKRYRLVAEIAGHPRVRQTISGVDLTALPSRYRRFFSLIMSRRIRSLVIYAMCLAYRKRTKLLLKKLLGR